MIFKIIARWILRNDVDEYIRGWGHGVDQHRKEPKSCEHHVTFNYWGEEE